MANDRRVALVTAAAGAGIGASVGRRLAADGLDVVVTDAHERRCREFARALSDDLGRDVAAYHLDVTNHGQARAVIDDVVGNRGRLDVLVNNAGWSKIEPVAEMSLETWQRCLDVDLTGTFVCMRYALPAMIAAGGGSIVNISSIAAWEMSDAHGAAYSAAKAGVLALTRVAAAAERGARGARQRRRARADLQRLPAQGLSRGVLPELPVGDGIPRPHRQARRCREHGFVSCLGRGLLYHWRGIHRLRWCLGPRIRETGANYPDAGCCPLLRQ